MKHLLRITLLIITAFAWTTLGLAQDAGATTQTADRQAQKQAERERKEAERRRKAEEKAEAERLRQQAGARCARLKRKQ